MEHLKQGWKLALACLPVQVWKVLGGYKSSITNPFVEYDFGVPVYFILARIFLNENLPALSFPLLSSEMPK